MSNPFAEVLIKSPLPSPDPRPVEVLDEFCDGVREATSNVVFCRRERGFLTNQGQEYRIIIRSESTPYDQILLRAYVPLNGWDVILDLYDDNPKICADETTLRRELENFLEEPTTRETIGYYSR